MCISASHTALRTKRRIYTCGKHISVVFSAACCDDMIYVQKQVNERSPHIFHPNVDLISDSQWRRLKSENRVQWWRAFAAAHPPKTTSYRFYDRFAFEFQGHYVWEVYEYVTFHVFADCR